MKTVAENHAMGFHGQDRSIEGVSHGVVMGKIGEDLRDFYSDMTEAEQPSSLLVLAQVLDARLAADGPDR